MQIVALCAGLANTTRAVQPDADGLVFFEAKLNTRIAPDTCHVLIFSNIDTTTPNRERATVWASFDGGQTWPVKLLVHDGPSAYSALAAGRPGTASEGRIFLHFESGNGSKVARFKLACLLEGERTGDGAVPARQPFSTKVEAGMVTPHVTDLADLLSYLFRLGKRGGDR